MVERISILTKISLYNEICKLPPGGIDRFKCFYFKPSQIREIALLNLIAINVYFTLINEIFFFFKNPEYKL